MSNVKKSVKNIVKKEVKAAVKKRGPKRAAPKRRKGTTNRANLPNKGGALFAKVSSAINHKNAQAADLAKALCCPNMYPSYRVQDGYSSMPTSASDPFMCIPASFSATDGSAADVNGIPKDEGFAAAFRDPRRALVYYDGADRTYQYAIINQEGDDYYDIAPNDEFEISHAVVDSGSTTTAVHGDSMYTGCVKEGPGSDHALLLAQHNQSLRVEGLPNSTSTRVTIGLLIGGTYEDYISTATTDGSGNWEALFSTFRAVSDATQAPPSFFYWGHPRLNQQVTSGRFLFKGTSIPTLCQLALTGFQDMEQVLEKLRFNALNLMYSNTAPALNRNGFAAGWQAPGDMDPIHLFTAGFEHLATRPNAERMVNDQGIHGFWKSTDPSDWEYLEVGDPDDDDRIGQSSFSLFSDSDYLVVMFKQPIAAGRAGYFTVFTDVQFRHDSVWLSTGFPEHERATFELALEIQGKVPQWHCNPFHIKDIFKWIGGHKKQIQDTFGLIDGATGYRSSAITGPLSKGLDVWFK